eukprot:3316091-Rhodomonas_salina.2
MDIAVGNRIQGADGYLEHATASDTVRQVVPSVMQILANAWHSRRLHRGPISRCGPAAVQHQLHGAAALRLDVAKSILRLHDHPIHAIYVSPCQSRPGDKKLAWIGVCWEQRDVCRRISERHRVVKDEERVDGAECGRVGCQVRAIVQVNDGGRTRGSNIQPCHGQVEHAPP